MTLISHDFCPFQASGRKKFVKKILFTRSYLNQRFCNQGPSGFILAEFEARSLFDYFLVRLIFTRSRSKCGENLRQAFEVTEPQTSELVNRVFSRQTGIRNASIRYSLINRWSIPMSLLSKAHGYEAWVRNCIQATSSTCLSLCHSIDAKSCQSSPKSSK